MDDGIIVECVLFYPTENVKNRSILSVSILHNRRWWGEGAFLIFDFKQLFNTTLYVDFDFRFKIIKGEIQI